MIKESKGGNMGVMRCDRAGCDSVCCERYGTRYGYICLTCFDELIKKGFGTDIEKFMNTEKNMDMDEDYQELWEKQLNKIFN